MATESRIILICGQTDQTGYNESGTEITVLLGDTEIFSGAISADPVIPAPWPSGQVLANVAATFDTTYVTGAVDYTADYSVLPVTLTVDQGAVAVHSWAFNMGNGPNPLLTPEELAICLQGQAAREAAPIEMKQDVKNKGGWIVARDNVFLSGIRSPSPESVQLDCKRNGVGYEFDPGQPDDYVSYGRTMFAQEGDVLTWMQMIFRPGLY